MAGWWSVVSRYTGRERSCQRHDALAEAGAVRDRNTIQNGVLNTRIIIREPMRNGETNQLRGFGVR